MPDPLLLEQRFRSLQETLRLTSSPRMRLLRLVEFGEQFRDPSYRSMFTGFAPELFQELAKAGSGADFRCTPPAMLRSWLDFLVWSEGELPELVPRARWTAVRQRLQQQLIMVQTWAEDRRDSIAVPEAGARMQESVWIPLVEREHLFSTGDRGFACLRRLRVQVHPQRGAHPGDEVYLHPLSDDFGLSDEGLRNALAAARVTLKTLTGVEIRQPLLLYCSIGGTTPVTGHSLEAGLAAAMVSALARFAGHRREFGLRHDAAVTGRISPEGALLPVDERGLAAKIEACTWSWIKRVVVPHTQAERCRELADAASSSDGISIARVGITGAANLEELFLDRRITLSHHVPLLRHAAHVIWRRRTAAVVTLLAAVLLVTGKILYGPMDRNPAILAGSGEVLLVQNRAGETLDTLHVGEATAGAVSRNERVAVLADVDGDGVREVLWSRSSNDPTASEVCCRGILGDGPVWSTPLRRHIEYAGQPAKSDGFGIRLLGVDDLDADGLQEVMLLGNHSFFPSLLLRLDAETGEETGCYVHAGHLIDMQFADIDSNGIKEILVCGINNAFGEAVLAVLDPRHVRGAGPSTPAYTPVDYAPAAERWYVRIPRTVVGAAVPRERFSRAVAISVYGKTRTFRLTVVDQSEDPGYAATIDGLFGFDMHPISFDKASNYDATAARLYSEGRIPSVPGKAYFERFLSELRYWDGFSWSRSPVPNRRYATITQH